VQETGKGKGNDVQRQQAVRANEYMTLIFFFVFGGGVL
jgi:hypothetical protein